MNHAFSVRLYGVMSPWVAVPRLTVNAAPLALTANVLSASGSYIRNWGLTAELVALLNQPLVPAYIRCLELHREGRADASYARQT